MSNNMKLGPILGIESDDLYTICLLTDLSTNTVKLRVDGKLINAKKVGETYSSSFWRAECPMTSENDGRYIGYSIKIDGVASCDKNNQSAWQFYVPGLTELPKFAYASCNGFSDQSLKEKTSDPYALWKEMVQLHQEKPFSVLLMGGDQLYADSIWGKVKKLAEWSDLPRAEKVKRRSSKVMIQQIDRFYEDLYIERWSSPEMAAMLASIPSVMMWDDHDIFDGWGSYPEDIQSCEVYQAIFTQAKHYFELCQIRSIHNQSLLNVTKAHYAFSLSFRNYQILAIDNRAERTLKQVMSKTQWGDLKTALAGIAQTKDLLLLSAVPVVYRDFSFADEAFGATPWEEELTDDLKDHWRAKEHQGERAKLIMNLLDNTNTRQGRTVMLSGDIHIGCIGVVNDNRQTTSVKIHQVVSSGIVHPSPSMIEWFGIMAVTNDRDEFLNEDLTIKVSMLKPHGSNQYIRARNFVTLEQGTDDKLWVNWICEGNDRPVYPLDK